MPIETTTPINVKIETTTPINVKAETTTPINVKAEIRKYTLVGDDIYVKRYNKNNVPTWYKSLINDIVATDPTITDIQGAIDFLTSQGNGYKQSIVNLETLNTSINASLTTLTSRVNDNIAGIANLNLTKVDATQASAIALNVIGSTFGEGGLANSWFSNQISTYASDIQSTAMNISTLSSTLNDTTVRLDTVEEINITQNNQIAALNTSIANIASTQIPALQAQIDGALSTWFYNGEPTLDNAPANTWTDENTKLNHVGDLYYDKDTGYGYRFAYEDIEDNPDAGVIFSWIRITDVDVTKALNDAANAQATADGKASVYYGDLAPTLTIDDTGDIFINSNTKVIQMWNGSMWINVDTVNASTALSKLADLEEARDGLVNTYYVASPPNSGMGYGDYWVDTDSWDGFNYTVYRYENVDGSSKEPLIWQTNTGEVAMALSKAYRAEFLSNNAQATADGKASIYYGPTAPVLTVNDVGDIWVDTDNNNLTKTWDGKTWVDITNTQSNQAAVWSANASKLITAPDGSITGWSFGDGSNIQSYFKVHATNFSISDGTTGYTPFSISNHNINFNGVVDFTNTNTYGTTTINGDKITTGSITADKITANQIFVDHTIQSSNFTNVGGNGFRLKAHALGNSDDPTIYGGYIKGTTVEGAVLEGGTINGGTINGAMLNATGMFGGTYNANIVVNTNDPLNPAPAIACQLDVTGVQDIDATPTAIDFGTIFVNGTKSEVVTVSNLGTDNLTISGVSVDNTEYTVTNYTGSLAPGESTELTVTFAPTAAASSTAIVTIASDDPDEATFTVNLTGNAVNPPIIGVNPIALNADLTTGESSTQQFTISNTGESALDFSIEIEETMAPLKARISKINLPKSDGNFEKGNAAPSFLPAPKNNLNANVSSTKDETVTGYAANLFTSYFQNFDVTNPGTLNDMFAIGSFFAGAITPDNPELAYAIDYDVNHLWSMNLSTGVVEDLGTVAGLGGSATGMEYVGNTCYVVTYTGSESVLQTLDVATNSVTTVGSVAAGIVISLGKDGNGELFALNISDDKLYHVDAATGAGTVIGSVGFDANYAQGMGYDATNDVLYLAAYNNSTGIGELRVADTETGNTLAIGSLGNGAEMDMLTFIGGAGSGNWLTASPLEGTVPAGGSLLVDVTFDAEGLVGGDYAANINVNSNDPVTPVAVVEATMNVTGAPNIETEPTVVDFGQVFVGYPSTSTLIVSNTGTDDLVITNATVDNNAFSFIGLFPITLTSGTSTLFEISVNATSVGDISGVLTIESNDGNEPNKQVPLYATAVLPPAMAMDLSAISGYTEIGGTTEVVLTISNNGGSELYYGLEAELLGKSSKTTTIELEPSLVYINEKAKHNLTTDVPARTIVVNNGLTTQKSTVNVLVLSPDTDEYISELMAALTAFDDLTVTQYPLEGLATLTADELLPFDVVLSQNDLTWEASSGDRTNVGNVLADYIDAGGKVVANMYLYSYDGWGLAGRFITEGYGPFVSTTRDIWGAGSLGTIHNPNHPLMEGVNAIDDSWGHQDPTVASGADLIADWSDGQPMIAVNENVVGLNILPINGNSSWASDLATLLHNSIIYLGGSSWLTIEPSEGVVNAGSSQEVTFTMNSEGMSEGTYYGTLHVFSNDPTNVYSTMDITFGVGTGIGGGNGNIPSKYELSQNYPNPFNPSTNIIYALPVSAKVTVKIFDVLGREVSTLVNKQVEAGTHSIKFNGINLTSGVYFYAIRAEGVDGSSFVDAKKFILMK